MEEKKEINKEQEWEVKGNDLINK